MQDQSLLHTSQWVSVAFPISKSSLFSYHCQSSQHPEVGLRVVAPFGSRNMTGIIMDCPDKVNVKTKAIHEILDIEPIFTKEQIKLIHQCVENYACSYGDIIQTILLKGLNFQTKKKIMPSGQHGKPLNEIEEVLYQHLLKSGQWDYQYFSKNRKKDIPILKSILKKGWIEISAKPIQTKTRIKEVLWYRKTDKTLEKKPGPKQKQILALLEKSNTWVDKNDLEHQIGNITPSIKSLLKKAVIEEKTTIENTTQSSFFDPHKHIELTDVQKSSLQAIENFVDQNKTEEILLHGVTGSGKTEIYLQATQYALQKGKSVLALVPEISLTPQFVKRFIDRFGDQVSLLHSKRTDAERVTEWFRILQGDAKVVVGTRSAIFSPLHNIGLIILDEFHDHSYKQHDGIRYHATDIAQIRSKHHSCPIIFGSATPTIERYYKMDHKITMPDRVTGHSLPDVEVCDVKNEKDFGKKYWIGGRLKTEMEKTLSHNKQILLFLNRRGYSHVVYCYRCGSEVHCPHCAVTMTFHKAKKTAQCHYCFYEHSLDTPCPKCHQGSLVHFGMGTQKIQEELEFTFPDARIERLDRDQSYKKNIFPQTMNKMAKGEIDILIGTQMITKGLDLPNIELVGVLLADQSLYFPDYLASETTFQLLTQVVGRSGRGKNKGKALIQTLQPDHYAIKFGAQQSYQDFYQAEITFREAMQFPPFSHMVLFEGVSTQLADVDQMMQWLSQQVKNQIKDDEISLLGPAPAPISKVRDDYRFHVLLKSNRQNQLYELSRWLYKQAQPVFDKRKIKLKMDINPIHFL